MKNVVMGLVMHGRKEDNYVQMELKLTDSHSRPSGVRNGDKHSLKT